jgi:glutathione S-transferase
MAALVTRILLWHLPLSPYSEKVRWTLDYKRVPHTRRAAVPGLHIPLALALTGGRAWTLPVMAIDGHNIDDSTAIIAALEQRHPDPDERGGRGLYPADPAERRRALELEDWFDEQLGPAVRRFSLHAMRGDREQFDELASRQLPRALRRHRRFAGAYGRAYSGARFQTVSEGRSDAARETILAAFDRLESELGAGDYLVAGRFTVADLTAASMFSLVVLPPEGPLDIVPPPAIVELRQSLADRRGYRWVLEVFARHRRSPR